MPDRFSLTISWNNGSVPPPYRTSEKIAILPDGSGTWTLRKGYGDDHVSTRAFLLSAPEVHALAARLEELGLWRIAWAEPERVVVGGGTTPITAQWGDQTANVPSIVVREQSDARSQIKDAIRKAIPSS